jgi:hypothetical protein
MVAIPTDHIRAKKLLASWLVVGAVGYVRQDGSV